MLSTSAPAPRSSRSGSLDMRVALAALVLVSLAACATSDVITGVSGGSVDRISVSLDPPAPTGADVTLSVGDSATLAATPLNELGFPVPGIAVTWSSEDTEVVAVTGPGVIRAVGPGRTRVFATASGVIGAISVTVRDTVGVAPSAGS